MVVAGMKEAEGEILLSREHYASRVLRKATWVLGVLSVGQETFVKLKGLFSPIRPKIPLYSAAVLLTLAQKLQSATTLKAT